MSKWDKEKRSLIDSIRDPFKFVKSTSKRSESISNREMDPENFLRRVTPQILEMKEKGLDFSTPEKWDEGFTLLGGGQSRRTSKSILDRMTWNQFLYNAEQIINS